MRAPDFMMRLHNFNAQLHHYLLAALAICLLAAPAGATQPSEIIFPPQSLPLNFSHKKHLDKKIACDFCHDKVGGSHKSSDNLIPGEDVCATCHPIDRDEPAKVSKSATACSFCHAGYAPDNVARVVMPAPSMKFDHAVHLGKGIDCARCHPRMENVELATRASLPTMPLCLSCHDSQRGGLHAPSRCSTCHLTERDGTLTTSLPEGTLVPSGTLRGDAHTMNFRTDHKAVAGADPKYCASCHRQSFCLDCHNGVVKPMDFHGNDYVSRHAIDARKDDPKCSGCHRAQTFCLGCHERLGIVDVRTGVDKTFAPIGTRQFHPAGWADPVAGPTHHKWQAERNLKQCVSCHRQETCLQCHATNASSAGGAGKMWVDPHPPTWRNSDRCLALVERNPRVCLQCHAPKDPELSCR
jgi:hypothetical protein